MTTTRPLRLRPAYVPLAAVAVASMLLVSGCTKSAGTGAPSASASGSPTTLLDKALAEVVSGDTASAKRDFEALAAQEPSNKLAFYNLGYIAQKANDDATAQTQYNKTLAIDPNYEPALYNLAILTTKKGDAAGARDLYKRAIKSNPNDANAHFNLGLILQQLGDKAGGLAELQQAIKLNPKLKLPSASPSK